MRISRFDVKKALVDHILANPLGLPVIVEGGTEQSTPDADHLKEHCLWGPTNITIDPDGRDNVEAIYQIDVNTEIAKGNFYNASLVDQISDYFGKGRSAGIEHNGQVIEVQRIETSSMSKNDANTHIVCFISVYFRAV